MILAALEFPSIDNIVKWPAVGPGFNKIAFISVFAVVATSLFFILAGRRRQLIPKGAQNLAEATVDFFDKGIIQQTIGHGGEKYIPYLASVFFFVFIGNIFTVIPAFAMPANARMANPAFLGLLTLVFFVCVGIKAQGPKYFWNAVAPPGVPVGLLFVVVPIEFLSTFIVRPFSLAVRLFANVLAGHILLVTFSVLTYTLLKGGILAVISPLPFAMLLAVTGFEIMVAFLQAYVFSILAAVYIGGAAHPEH